MDRGYLDFARLYALHQTCADFVIQAKTNLCFIRYTSRPRTDQPAVRSDQTGRLALPQSRQNYPVRTQLGVNSMGSGWNGCQVLNFRNSRPDTTTLRLSECLLLVTSCKYRG